MPPKAKADQATEAPAEVPTPAPVPTIHQALAAARLEIGSVGKDSTAPAKVGGFRFRGVDAVVNAASRILGEHGINVIPEVLSVERTTTQSRGGATMLNVYVTTRFTFYGPAGDSVAAVVMGEAADAGDKATSKAQSVALRVALLQALLLPTDEPDPDTEGYERAGRGQADQREHGQRTGGTQQAPADPPAHVRALAADLDALTGDQQAWVRANWPQGFPPLAALTVSQVNTVREVLAAVPPPEGA